MVGGLLGVYFRIDILQHCRRKIIKRAENITDDKKNTAVILLVMLKKTAVILMVIKKRKKLKSKHECININVINN
jgi:hypothetical protein